MGLSLYIHYPFCKNLCSYCDYYKETYSAILEKEYFKALKTELELTAKTLEPDQRILKTIYFGGGTPSLAGIDLLRDFLKSLKRIFKYNSEIEFSFEINPESIYAEKLAALKELGINRPIIGIQSFNQGLLTTLGRKHNLTDSFRAVYLAKALGFTNFGIDMLFGLSRQTTKKLSDDLNQLVDLSPPHISYYQLTIEEGTPLELQIKNKKPKHPGKELMAAMYHAINQELTKHNYKRYEISSFSLPGFESKHNLNYWQGGDYLGLGPSAHSFIGNRRFANIDNLNKYITQIRDNHRPLIFDSDDIKARISEAIIFGLRTTDGIDRIAFQNRFGVTFESAVNFDNFSIMKNEKLISVEKETILLTDTGLPLADEIISRLIK